MILFMTEEKLNQLVDNKIEKMRIALNKDSDKKILELAKGIDTDLDSLSEKLYSLIIKKITSLKGVISRAKKNDDNMREQIKAEAIKRFEKALNNLSENYIAKVDLSEAIKIMESHNKEYIDAVYEMESNKLSLYRIPKKDIVIKRIVSDSREVNEGDKSFFYKIISERGLLPSVGSEFLIDARIIKVHEVRFYGDGKIEILIKEIP